ncbi:haloacid dehalogenase-like hydrolase [Bifidobacterium ramosum]|nr:HAD family hydrolase [Bifidobacterium ramosum]KAB8288435.1 haloacid dehalogenase-like hydrolase [Bifidobacterium ramosum]
MRYDAVFFDLYGTLVDIRTDESCDTAWRALSDALREARGDGRFDDDLGALRQAFDAAAAPIRVAATAAHGEWAEPDLLPAYAALLDDPVSSPVALSVTSSSDVALSSDTAPPSQPSSSTTTIASPLPPTHTMASSRTLAVAHTLAWTFRRASTQLLHTYAGAIELLHTLRSRGLRVVLVSNAQACYTRPELDLLGLADAFDRIVISSEEGVRKPSPELFRRAMEREGLQPSQVVMIGNDERSDILGARSAGIDGIYLRTAISPADDPAVSEHAVRSFAGADYAGILRFLGLQQP